ncbi:MAG TPA: enoyl-CoA hydratase-related protein [Frankiaceae bacterium]|jgi:enoyl-CoA hydratase|nr:enoyl-CoA hydratase-related protein [Frankiaceae bacterium]
MTDASVHLRSDDDEGIRILTIDRPETKNALNGPLMRGLRSAFAAADADDDVRLVVLTAVDPVFSAGVDFKQVEPGSADSGAQTGFNPASVLREMRKPVICAVNGACVSGALEIALSASFVIASDRARFADTHALLGVVPTWGLTALLPRAVGLRKAREMSVTGDFVHAEEALRLGLVNHVVAHAELLPFTLEVARRIPAAAAVGDVLGLYRRGDGLPLADALEQEAAFTTGRTYDMAAFTAAGRAAATRGRASPESRKA